MSRYTSQMRADITPGGLKSYLTPEAGGTMGVSPYDSGMGSGQGLGLTPEMGLGGAIGGLLGSMFGGGDAPDPGQYLKDLPGQISPYMKPYMQAGQQALGPLGSEYQQLMSHPGEMMNKLGGQFHESPGFNFAMNQAMQGAGHQAAAGGMAGSPEAQQQAQRVATGLGQQDYYNWLNQARGMMGQGLGGMQQMAGMGMQGATNMANVIASQLMAQAQEAQEQQAQQAQQSGGMGGLLGSLAGAAMHFIPGL